MNEALKTKPDDILTAKQVAAILSVNTQTVYTWANAGMIGKRIAQQGKRGIWRFTRNEITKLLEKRNGNGRDSNQSNIE